MNTCLAIIYLTLSCLTNRIKQYNSSCNNNFKPARTAGFTTGQQYRTTTLSSCITDWVYHSEGILLCAREPRLLCMYIPCCCPLQWLMACWGNALLAFKKPLLVEFWNIWSLLLLLLLFTMNYILILYFLLSKKVTYFVFKHDGSNISNNGPLCM